ncbi:MAG: hypothetical protein HC831_10190 [Chloroflexia bacterium]|nr:hypothetical protein [Chloroflexia bacterium]
MQLKTKLDQLLANGKLGDAMDLLMEKAKNVDNNTYNTLILLKSQYSDNQRSNNLGIISRSDYNRENSRITYAFQQTLNGVNNAVLNSEVDNGNSNQPYPFKINPAPLKPDEIILPDNFA